MGLTIEYGLPGGDMAAKVKATKRLFVSVDGTKLVEENDREAGFLFCVPGSEVSRYDAERFGMIEPEKKLEPPKPAEEVKAEEPKAEPKADPVEPVAEKKAMPKSANKEHRKRKTK